MIDPQTIESWRQSIEPFIINDIRKAMATNDLEVGLVILTMVGIDALGGYLCGSSSTATTFKRFIKKYLPTYTNYAESVWILRCGLLHDYVTDSRDKLSGFIMNRNRGEPHLVVTKYNNKEYVAFNRWQFAEDFLTAWNKYLQEVSNNQDLFDKLKKRINNRSFLVVKPVSYKK